MQQIIDKFTPILEAIVNANSCSERKALFKENPELLRDQMVLHLVDYVITLLQEENDQHAIRLLQELRSLITHCRQHSIDATFADYKTIAPYTYLSDLEKEESALAGSNGIWDRSKITRCIEIAREMLRVVERSEDPNRWALNHSKLGRMLVYLQQDEQARDTEKGSKLGRMLGYLEQEGPAQDIKQAIEHLELALEVFQPDTAPNEYGDNHFCLGQAYWILSQSESRWENIESSIDHWGLALYMKDRQVSPIEWANNQYHLGLAFYSRIFGDRKRNLEQALRHLTAAVTIYAQHDDFLCVYNEWAKVQEGLAYTQRDIALLDKIANRTTQESIS